MFGLGLVDAVTDATLAALEDPNDLNGDDVSGRVHWVQDHHGQTHAGKFWRKSEVAHLDECNAEAFQNEQGVTNPEFPSDGVVIDGGTVLDLQTWDAVSDPEVSEAEMHALNMYVKLLAPARRNNKAIRGLGPGRALFDQVGCASCHTPEMQTGPHEIRALNNQKIEPYSDFLLHDMGSGLAEGCKGSASPQEWRTEPLWGLRFVDQRRTGYLHGGRADSQAVADLTGKDRDDVTRHEVLALAIQVHGSEGSEGNGARDAFEALSDSEKTSLLSFLETL